MNRRNRWCSIRTNRRALWLGGVAVALTACQWLTACQDQAAAGGSGEVSGATPSASVSAATTPVAATPSSETSAASSHAGSAASAASSHADSAASSEPSGAPSGSPSASPGKSYDCGGKGQKACPMQGWMKGVMARAVADNNAEKIAQGLNTIASKPPPGMSEWAQISAAGAAKAKAGDIDGAKESCKKCHALYQKSYKETMRDRPW